jgi:TPR repeat protein
MEAIAGMYEAGQGTRKDLNEARVWYESASRNGSPAARKWLAAHPEK